MCHGLLWQGTRGTLRDVCADVTLCFSHGLLHTGAGWSMQSAPELIDLTADDDLVESVQAAPSGATASSTDDIDDLPLVQRLSGLIPKENSGGSSAAADGARGIDRQLPQGPLHPTVDAAPSARAHWRPGTASANFTGFGRITAQGSGPPGAVAGKRLGQAHTSDLFAQAEVARSVPQLPCSAHMFCENLNTNFTYIVADNMICK